MTVSNEFCFSQPGLVLIPAEHWSAQGISKTFRGYLESSALLSSVWMDLFDQSVARYWQRLTVLNRCSPAYWFPPRTQNIAIVTQPELVRPYFQPFNEAAWLLYEGDFCPTHSNVEFAVFQLLQVERMGLLKQVVGATGANLSYWLQRSDEEVNEFRQACELSQRVDVHTAKALAKALPWLRRQFHSDLAPPDGQSQSIGDLVEMPGTGLLIRRNRIQDMERLVQSCTKSATTTVERFYSGMDNKKPGRGGDQGESLCQWLASNRPRLLITGEQGKILWDYGQPQKLDALRPLLKPLSASVAESLRADWAVVGTKSSEFVSSLVDESRLPPPRAHYADQNGLSYMHIQRREVAYNIQEEGMQRLREVTPPFERWMLAARTIHEWGHIFVDQGWVPVAEEKQSEYRELLEQCALIYEQILESFPAQVRRRAKQSIAGLQKNGESSGVALAQLTIARIEDFQANLMAQRFLSPEEMETYVRNNHRSHVHDYARDAYLQRLARYAYEFQYLRFSSMDDPLEYFWKTTWAAEQYVHNGLVREESITALLETTGHICDCYLVDESQFRQ